MSIEVKQMTVKTNIVHRPETIRQNESSHRREPSAAEMGRILDACRRMVVELLTERQER